VEFVASRQCRPLGGRALSLASEPEIDRDLALLTYEVAALVSQLPGRSESADTEEMRATTAPQPDRTMSRARRVRPSGRQFAGGFWEGRYGPVDQSPNRAMQLVIDRVTGDRCSGRTIWPGAITTTTFFDDGSVTSIGDENGNNADDWSDPRFTLGDISFRLRFTDVRKEGGQVELEGDYRVVVGSDARMLGLWYRKGSDRPIGQFELKSSRASGEADSGAANR
jgi:hypothetical protein